MILTRVVKNATTACSWDATANLKIALTRTFSWVQVREGGAGCRWLLVFTVDVNKWKSLEDVSLTMLEHATLPPQPPRHAARGWFEPKMNSECFATNSVRFFAQAERKHRVTHSLQPASHYPRLIDLISQRTSCLCNPETGKATILFAQDCHLFIILLKLNLEWIWCKS